jgi:hypothetical protein
MYQKDYVRSVWKAAGLYDENDAKLQQFLKLLDEPTLCWAEMVDTCRRSFASYKARLVQPILNSGDKLVRLTLIRAAVPSNEDEMALLEQHIAAADPVRDHLEFKAIALKNVPRLNEALKKNPKLTPELRATMAAQVKAVAVVVTPVVAAPATPAGKPAADVTNTTTKTTPNTTPKSTR